MMLRANKQFSFTRCLWSLGHPQLLTWTKVLVAAPAFKKEDKTNGTSDPVQDSSKGWTLGLEVKIPRQSPSTQAP